MIKKSNFQSILNSFEMRLYTPDPYHIIYENNDIIILIIKPHEDTDFQWLCRITTKAAFDRWANSTAIEKYFNSEQDIYDWIDNHTIEIYAELLSYLSEEYWDLENTKG